ncbi:LysR family transcriptional regulator [Methylobacterium sp. EM32]|uniref:LysR family transcriptional regulator n=1 Tax=Methylobacterium sp. EM32 TaxID=3163481 RepID=UPI0033B8015F
MASGAGSINDASIMSLRCFVAVVETQNFSAAARQLRVAPSSVTKGIQLLESAVGVALFHRTTRRMTVTEAGARFYEQCVGILTQLDRATAAMAAEKALGGNLRITVPPSFAASILGPNLPGFLRQHPAMSIDVIVTSDTPDLIGGRIDAAIVVQDEPSTKLRHLLLAACPRVLCAAPGYIDRHGAPRRPADLGRHHCMSSRFSDLAETWHFRCGERQESVRVSSTLLSSSGELLRQACINGGGIANLYSFHVRDDLESGRLVRVLPDYVPRARNVYAIIPHHQIVRPQTKAFLSFVSRLVRDALGADAADIALDLEQLTA